jgi:hypothetical protein
MLFASIEDELRNIGITRAMGRDGAMPGIMTK